MEGKKRLALIIGILAVIAVGILLYIYFVSARHEFKITFFNIGQGDAALIQFETGEKILVDCGKDKNILSKLGKALPFYDREIDYLFITHYDSDHYGGCVDVLRRYKVKKIVDNGIKKPGDPYFDSFEYYRSKESAEGAAPEAGEIWQVGDNKLEFYSPGLGLLGEGDEQNKNSLVFELRRGEKEWLFMGDAGVEVEVAMLAKFCSATSTCPIANADVLKAGHHGSDTSSGEEFLKIVRPKETVISVGKNSFGHPSLRVIRKLERADSKILRTDERGDIIYK